MFFFIEFAKCAAIIVTKYNTNKGLDANVEGGEEVWRPNDDMLELKHGQLSITVHVRLLDNFFRNLLVLVGCQFVSCQRLQHVLQVVQADKAVLVEIVDLKGVKHFNVPRCMLTKDGQQVEELLEAQPEAVPGEGFTDLPAERILPQLWHSFYSIAGHFHRARLPLVHLTGHQVRLHFVEPLMHPQNVLSRKECAVLQGIGES